MKKSVVGLMVLLIAVAGFAQNQVTFNVNMRIQTLMGNFDPTVDTLVVRGSVPPLSWSGYDNILTDPEGDSIYSITIDFGEATDTVEYKYVIHYAGGDDYWEPIPGNRSFELTGSPQVLDTVYFGDITELPIWGTVIFQVDLRVQEIMGNFRPGIDYPTVRGGTPPLTWEENDANIMQPWDTIYVLPVEFYVGRGTVIEYKYHICPDTLWGNENPYDGIWESGPNYTFEFDPRDEEGNPVDTGGFQVLPLRYFDNIGPEDILMQDVTAIFRVDMRYVFYAIRDQGYWYAEGALDTVYSVDSVYIAGSVPPLVWVWDQPTYPPELQMKDDGVYPDEVAGDSIYTVALLFPAGSPKRIEHKYGVNGEDTEAGFLENHFVELKDTGSVYWVPVEVFGSFIYGPAANDDPNGIPIQDGEELFIRGVVTVADEFGGPSFIQDFAAGIAVWDADFTNTVEVGNEVKFTATVSYYRGLTELTDVTNLETVHESVPFDTLVITCADLADTIGELYEGRLVMIENVTTTDAFPPEGSSGSVTITDATGSCTMYIDRDTDIDGTTAPTGPFNVVGVVSQYDPSVPYWSGYEILPRSLDDIITGVEETQAPRVYMLAQNIPNPFTRTTTIRYQLPKAGEVTIAVYNLLGERITTLVDGTHKPGLYELNWDGRDSRGRRVAPGVYFYRMDVRSASGKHEFSKTCKLILLR